MSNHILISGQTVEAMYVLHQHTTPAIIEPPSHKNSPQPYTEFEVLSKIDCSLDRYLLGTTNLGPFQRNETSYLYTTSPNEITNPPLNS